MSISPDRTRSIEGKNVYAVRKQIGVELAREQPADADLVVPVPDSGTPAAIGFAQGAGLPFELGIIRNHYVGRTFIQPTDSIRHMGVKLKHNANRKMLEGKRVVLVDDSIVRGTTSQKIVQMVRDAGAREVHMRIASPPTMSSCFYGVDTPETQKLLAHRMNIEEMRDFIRVDSLGFLSLDGLYRAAGEVGAQQRNAAILRCLFLRAISDAADRPRRPRQCPQAFAACRGERLTGMTAKRLAGRIALVTGASRGIGYNAALAFAREGAHVIAVARTVGGLEELDDADPL